MIEEENKEEVSEEVGQDGQKKEMSPKLKQFIQILKFTGFSISAGVIQLLSFAVLYDMTHLLPWWPAYLISLTLSVLWNFTFNRKFTFKSAANVPLAMGVVVIYYCMFTPVSVFGGDAMTAAIGEELGIVTTVVMMLINFATEFVWDKFIVFNDNVIGRIEGIFKRKKGGSAPAVILEGGEPSDGEKAPAAEEEVPTEETVATDTLLLK
ncbi:MAG: GtrA family protein [Candidatus Coproplasma sp.]